MNLPRQIERYFEAECEYRDYCESVLFRKQSAQDVERWRTLRDDADRAFDLAIAFYEGMRAARERQRTAEEVEDVR